MILVDTSVWIDFLRGRSAVEELVNLLNNGGVRLHPWVLGEIALGSLGAKRRKILADLSLLPAAPVVSDHEVMLLVEKFSLAGSGLGWVDVQLLAAARVAGDSVWTNDKRLATAWATLTAGHSAP